MTQRNRWRAWFGLAALIALPGCGGDDRDAAPPTVDEPPSASVSDTSVPVDAIAFTDPIFDVARLDQEAMCRLVTSEDVVSTVGSTPEAEPTFRHIEGTGTSCVHYDAVSFDLLVRVEIDEIAYEDLRLLYTDEDLAEYADCTIGGRDALCVEPHESEGFQFGATVIVQIDEAFGPALLLSAPTVEASSALAEIALDRLDQD